MSKIVILIFCVFIARSSLASSEVVVDFVNQPVELEDKADVVKRQVQTTTAAPSKSNDYTSVKTKHGCKLYALEIVFFKKVAKTEPGQYDVTEIKVEGSKLKSINDGTCGNWSGTIVLDYEGLQSTQKKSGADLQKLTLTFNISYLRPHGWWELSTLEVDAKGGLIDKGGQFNQKFDGNVLKTVAIGGSKRFSYACGQPPTLYYSMDEKAQLVYGLKFRNLHIQPFEWKRSPGNFTDDVDDCVPFFSIGIWMFLVVAAVLLLVVFFGIGMISGLKTMDRFDDPKGKPLVINAKE